MGKENSRRGRTARRKHTGGKRTSHHRDGACARCTVANLLANAHATAEALRALMGLARAARHAATLSGQLEETAVTIEGLIDQLVPSVGCTVEDVYAPLFRGE